MTSREKFEAWVKFHLDDKFTEVPLYRGNGGLNYLDSQVDLAWIAWQAAETDMAVQLANAESKCRELAAENAEMRSSIDATIGWQESTDPENGESVRMLVGIKTPATDAFLAEVRAQGVEMYADNLDSSADDAERDGFDDAVKFLRSEASGVRLFAAQLRQEAK